MSFPESSGEFVVPAQALIGGEGLRNLGETEFIAFVGEMAQRGILVCPLGVDQPHYMSDAGLRQEGLDFEALPETDVSDCPTSHRAWIISGDVVANATNEDYQQLKDWIQELGGRVDAISQPERQIAESEHNASGGWHGIDVVDLDTPVVLLSRPVFDTVGKKIKAAKSSIGTAYNTTAYPRRAGEFTDKAKQLPTEIVSTERKGWISELAPIPGAIDLEVLKYASHAGLLTARLEGFGRGSQRIIDAVIQYTDEMLGTISTDVE